MAAIFITINTCYLFFAVDPMPIECCAAVCDNIKSEMGQRLVGGGVFLYYIFSEDLESNE